MRGRDRRSLGGRVRFIRRNCRWRQNLHRSRVSLTRGLQTGGPPPGRLRRRVRGNRGRAAASYELGPGPLLGTTLALFGGTGDTVGAESFGSIVRETGSTVET